MFSLRNLAGAVMVPALLLGMGTPAEAAGNTLTLTALNRNGVKAGVTATAVNLATNSSYTLKGGKAKKLPKGTYTVITSIRTGRTTTLAGKTVKVSGKSKLTIDARKGKKVSLAINPAPKGLYAQTEVRICTRSANGGYSVETSTFDNDAVYVVPTTSTKYGYAALGHWDDGSTMSENYAVLHQTVGVPSKPSRTYAVSSLAAVTVDTRRGPDGGSYHQLSARPGGSGCGQGLHAGLGSTDQPVRTKLRLTAGKWTIESDSSAAAKDGSTRTVAAESANRTVSGGKIYGLRFYGAGWGPGSTLPHVISGRINYPIGEMFEDPAFATGGYAYAVGEKATAKLVFGGKTVKTAKDKGWTNEAVYLGYTVKKAGWYTLSVDASRYYPEVRLPGALLSPKTAVTYRFKAKPKSSVLAPVYAVQIVPIGLNLNNQAKAGSTTEVAVKLNRLLRFGDTKKGANPKVTKVTAKVSTDNGKTWRATTVKKVGGTWTVLVRNPASGGVSLRTRATYSGGGYTEATVVRAYAVG
ncbi:MULTISPECIES: hypothetical protein [Actinoplanes]|uniref:hypothetical protein n=1 Tax=Actinoplanes TaxID=1865 RepID=UPI0005F2CDDF|nr:MULTISPECIES: hypothetical protein [Actinoplanes]GLY05079.1 hypothetical protein Acsp01_54580 [Actinoplanes sp. NBRC 101535]